jgi:epoxyqueuosine reductase
VALGNAPADGRVITALEARADDPSPIVREHVRWALARQRLSSAKTANCVTVEP